MPKWISIDEATHKYGVSQEDVRLWTTMKEIASSFIENVLTIDDESIQEFLSQHKTPPTGDYIQTLEQFCKNQATICELYATVIELQERDLQYQKRRISVLEKQQAIVTEQRKLSQKVVTMTSDTLTKAENSWLDKLWLKFRITGLSQSIQQSKHKKKR